MDARRYLKSLLLRHGLLLPVLLLGGAFMVYGIWAVRPVVILPDEAGAVDRALSMGMRRSPFIKDFMKGGNLHVHLLLVAFIPYYAYLVVSGRMGAVQEIAGSVSRGEINPWAAPDPFLSTLYDFIVIGRVLSVLAGIATIVVVYLLAKRIYDRRAGLLAATFLAGSMIFANIAHFVTEDLLVTFLVAATLLLLVYFVEERSKRALLAGSFTFGLAVSAKATAGMLLVPVAAAVLIYVGETNEQLPTTISSALSILPSFAIYPFLALLGYVGTTPSLLLYPRIWWQDVVFEILVRSSPYGIPELGWLVQVANLASGVGLPLFLLLIGGLFVETADVVKAPTRRDPRWPLLAFLFPYYLVIGSWDTTAMWYIVPLIPILVVLAGGVMSKLLKQERYRLAARLLLGGLIVFSFMYTGLAVQQFTSDSRIQATNWAAENIEPGSSVDVHATRHYLPGFQPTVNVTRRPLYSYTASPDRRVAMQRIRCRIPDYVVASSFHYGRFFRQPEAYESLAPFYERLLGGKYEYKRIERFGPSFDPYRSALERFAESLSPNAYAINPSVIILQRTAPPKPDCGGTGFSD